MDKPNFEFCALGDGNFVLNDNGRTVATVTRYGYIDWILRSPAQPGPLITKVVKETHLCHVFGLIIRLCMPSLTEGNMTGIRCEIAENGAVAKIIGDAVSKNGAFTSRTIAAIRVNPRAKWYEWDLLTTARCTSDQPVDLSWVEYNNIYPAGCGRCMLFAPEKAYHSTLMVDKAGVVWEFPHQHLMHYGAKIRDLHFGQGSVAGFFGEQSGSPVCILHESTLEPDWGICDMFYDLHCGSRTSGPIKPGQELRWRYTVKYLTPAQSRPLIQAAHPVPVTGADWQGHTYPRLELGMNHFDGPVMIDRMDDASGFRPRPPKLVWDRQVGHKRKGSLRITNATPEETVWTAEPPSQIPVESQLTLSGLIRTENIEGKGMYLRVRYHTWSWEPTPHVEWSTTLTSKPVSGTTDGWVRVTLPLLEVSRENFDYLIYVDVILDGQGTGWLTDVDVDLVRVRAGVPAGV